MYLNENYDTNGLRDHWALMIARRHSLLCITCTAIVLGSLRCYMCAVLRCVEAGALD